MSAKRSWEMGCALSVGLLLVAAAGQMSPDRSSDALRSVRSNEEGTRINGGAFLVQRRDEIINSLLDVLNGPLEANEPFYISTTKRNIAIDVLGKYRAVQAVPHLAAWLTPRDGQTLGSFKLWPVSPAGYALIRIGLPSVPAMLVGLKSNDMEGALQPDQCLRVLVAIMGVEETELLLTRELRKEPPEEEAGRLTRALVHLRNPKFPAESMQRLGAELLHGK